MHLCRDLLCCGYLQTKFEEEVSFRHIIHSGTGLAPHYTCTGSGTCPPTSAQRLGSPSPHLHRDSAEHSLSRQTCEAAGRTDGRGAGCPSRSRHSCPRGMGLQAHPALWPAVLGRLRHVHVLLHRVLHVRDGRVADPPEHRSPPGSAQRVGTPKLLAIAAESFRARPRCADWFPAESRTSGTVAMPFRVPAQMCGAVCVRGLVWLGIFAASMYSPVQRATCNRNHATRDGAFAGSFRSPDQAPLFLYLGYSEY